MALTYPYRARDGSPSAVDGIGYRRNHAQFPGATLGRNRNLGLAMVIVSDDYQMTDQDELVLVDCSVLNKDIVVSLPGATGNTYLQKYTARVVKYDAGAHTVTVGKRATTSDTVNGAAALAAITAQYTGWDIYLPVDDSSTGAGTGNGKYFAVACG